MIFSGKFTCKYSVVMDLGEGKYSRGSFVVEKSNDRFVCLTCQVTFSDLARAVYHVNQEHYQGWLELKSWQIQINLN